MGLSESVVNDDTISPIPNLSELEALADVLNQFNLSKVEIETIHSIVYDSDTEVQCITSVLDIKQAHTQEQRRR